jgi:hypothetical protein
VHPPRTRARHATRNPPPLRASLGPRATHFSDTRPGNFRRIKLVEPCQTLPKVPDHWCRERAQGGPPRSTLGQSSGLWKRWSRAAVNRRRRRRETILLRLPLGQRIGALQSETPGWIEPRTRARAQSTMRLQPRHSTLPPRMRLPQGRRPTAVDPRLTRSLSNSSARRPSKPKSAKKVRNTAGVWRFYTLAQPATPSAHIGLSRDCLRHKSRKFFRWLAELNQLLHRICRTKLCECPPTSRSRSRRAVSFAARDCGWA